MNISIDYRKYQRFESDMNRLRDCLLDEYGREMNYSDTGELIYSMVKNADSNRDFTNFISSLCDVLSEWRNLTDE